MLIITALGEHDLFWDRTNLLASADTRVYCEPISRTLRMRAEGLLEAVGVQGGLEAAVSLLLWLFGCL